MIGSYSSVFGQKENTTIPSSMSPTIPPTPQATALTRLAEYQANNWTGTPDISIPLFDMDCDGYTIPLRLSYEAQPLKPGYVLDVYGRGWTLSGGSCVSRVIRSGADETNDFEIDEKTLNQSFDALGSQYKQNMDKMKDHNFQSDLFNIVLPTGRSVDFVIHKKNNQLKYELSDIDRLIKIKCNYTTYSINSFSVTDENGIRYDFKIADKSSCAYEDNRFYNTTWLLTDIVLTNGRTIHYEYTDKQEAVSRDPYHDAPITNYREPMLTIGSVYPTNFNIGEEPYWLSMSMMRNCTNYYEHLLTSISCGSMTVEFNYSPQAKDMIKDIEIKYKGARIRKIDFDIQKSSYMRTLGSLTIQGKDSSKQKYSFNYYIPAFPSVSNNSTDHWGNYTTGSCEDIANFNFFVQKVAYDFNKELLLRRIGHAICMPEKTPQDKNDYTYKFTLQHTLSGDTRTASSPHSHGVLSSITYPNGGHTDFEYENHRFLSASMPDGSMQFERRLQRIVEGGGFRIKSIRNYDVNNNLVDQYEYCYGPTYKQIRETRFPFPDNPEYSSFAHTGCGEAVVDPNLLTYLSYDQTVQTPSGIKEMLLGIKNDNQSQSFSNCNLEGTNRHCWWEARFSAQNFRNLLGGRPAVVYPEITVYHGTIHDVKHPRFSDVVGKTVYKYDVYNYTSPRTYQNQFYHKMAPDTTYMEPVYYLENTLYSEEHKAKRNHLISKTEYGKDLTDSNGEFYVSTEEKYEYTNNENSFQSGYVYNNHYNMEHNRPCPADEGPYYNLNNFTHTPAVATGMSTISLGILHSRVSDYIGCSKPSSKTMSKRFGDPHYFYNQTTSEEYSYEFADCMKSRNYDEEGIRKYENTSFIYDQADSTGIIPKMKQFNMIAMPCAGTTSAYSYMGTTVIDGYRINYGEYIIDGKSYFLPSEYLSRYNNQYEPSIKVLSYTLYGKPEEIVNLKTGVHTVYLWCDDYRNLRAEIQNATINEVRNVLRANSVDKLREVLPNSLVRTWTYIPLIGVSSSTDETGRTTHYDYDGLGRLTEIYTYNNGVKESLSSYQYIYPNK